MTAEVKPFRLDFSNRVIEHLGIKLYQNKPTNVISEFVSNSWDADAKRVFVDLRTSSKSDAAEIAISDNGRGMTRRELTDEFLIIGRNRRKKSDERTPGGRTPMGRKGIGKLAGFGIAETINVVSIPNPKEREGEDDLPEVPIVYWLRFNLNEIRKKEELVGLTNYSPEVVADGVSLEDFESLIQAEDLTATFSELVAEAKGGGGGVCVHLFDLTLKKAINPQTLLSSIANRFTVAMLNPKFELKVNGKKIDPSEALPTFQGFADLGSVQAPIVEAVPLGGIDREVRYWVKFVSLSDEAWPIENSGVGVFAHGKIAQDRPFFFGVRGKEIFSRYLYAVVEADWLDELPEDVVSTDRRSINWDTTLTAEFHKWGTTKVASWIESFQKWRKEQPKKDVIKRIREVSTTKLAGPEEEALAELLSDLLPSLGNDEEAKNKATLSFKAAWTHEPTRELTKVLWGEVFSPNEVDGTVFGALLERLRTSLVPEAMGLAVTVAQRVAAITAMTKMIESDKTETHLQRLIEEFPWLIGPQWERLTANEQIKTLVEKKFKPDVDAGGWEVPKAHGVLKPDFVFLSDVGNKDIVVFELKGPESGKTLQIGEYHQLRQYLDIIEGVYGTSSVTGILVGHESGGFKESDTRIKIWKWIDVLASARAMHVSYLATLLKASEPDIDDARLKQIANFGGKETLDLLQRLHEIGNFPSVVVDALAKTPVAAGKKG